MKLFWLLAAISAKVIEINDTDSNNDKIKQIVVLMLENRSFDSFLGRLKLDGINPDVNGISERMVNYADNLEVGTRNVGRDLNKAFYDPGHHVGDVTEQIYGPGFYNGEVAGKEPKMTGFAQNVMRNFAAQNVFVDKCFSEVFGLHGPDSLPVTYALAREYSVVDDWYASVPGPTFPNRHFLQCATSLGKMENNLNYVTGLKCKTLYENLSENRISWNVYSDGLYSSTAMYSYFRNPLNQAKVHNFEKFKKDAKAGNLPQFSYIDPDFQKSILVLIVDDNHPPHLLSSGETFLREVYESLRASPQWESTLLIVTYDEHGGHYDHVPPPVNVPIPDMESTKPDPPSGDFQFDRLGVRVPTLLISPWIPKGDVFRSGMKNRYIEHSSISATLKNKFNLEKYLTARDAWAVSLHSVTNYLQEPRTDCIETIPTDFK